MPADDPLLRLRAAPRRKVEPKPVPEEALKEARRRAFTPSKFCREGCTSPEHACPKCQSFQRWKQHRSALGRKR